MPERVHVSVGENIKLAIQAGPDTCILSPDGSLSIDAREPIPLGPTTAG